MAGGMGKPLVDMDDGHAISWGVGVPDFQYRVFVPGTRHSTSGTRTASPLVNSMAPKQEATDRPTSSRSDDRHEEETSNPGKLKSARSASQTLVDLEDDSTKCCKPARTSRKPDTVALRGIILDNDSSHKTYHCEGNPAKIHGPKSSLLLSINGDDSHSGKNARGPHIDELHSFDFSECVISPSIRSSTCSRKSEASEDSPYTNDSKGSILCNDGSQVSTPQSFLNIENSNVDNKASRRRTQPQRKRRRPNKLADAPPTVSMRRSSRQRHRLKGDSSRMAFSRVEDYQVDFRQLQCIVELPADATPGQRYCVKWPTVFPCHPPKVFVIEVPFSVELIPINTRRFIKVVAPGLSFDPLREAISSLLQVQFPVRRNSKSSRVRVGENYQASIVPSDQVPTVGPSIDESPLLDKFWDANDAKAALERGEDVMGFVDEAMELNEKVLRMEALHDTGYHVNSARARLQQMLTDATDIPIALTNEEQQVTDASVAFARKQFRQVAKEIGRTSCATMVHYYNWKKSKSYQIAKQELAVEKDFCAICDDGGELIVCDHCHNAYHFACHKPPLHGVPSGDWFCSQCLKSPAKMRRLPFGPQLDTSPMKTSSNALPQSTPINLSLSGNLKRS